MPGISRKKNAPLQTIALLQESIPLVTNANEKSRLMYILGQLYFLQNNEQKALGYFEEVSKLKSNYDLAFQANLAINQIKDDEASLLKTLKEAKNEAYKPHVYVALGQIYYQKNDFEKAKEYWKLGAKNTDQKGELYLQLGHLFAKQFRKSKEAIVYYDSAMIYLSPSHEEYVQVKLLTEKWKKFDQILEAIQTNDSLLLLSQKSTSELKTIYQSIKAKQAKKDSSTTTKNSNTPVVEQVIFTRRQSSNEQQSFYFYNDMVRIRGEQEFVSKYGIRTLEDNWNRKVKNNASMASATFESNLPKIEQAPQKSESITTATKSDPADTFESWLSALPTSPKQLLEVQKKAENALFESGKFAKFELNDNDLAKEQLLKLLTKYPQTAHEAETYYLLYESEQINPKEKEQYKKLLFDKYPDSHFKTLVLKSETGSLSNNKELEAKAAYEAAYLAFKARKFEESYQQCLLLEQRYPGNKLEDKVMYLRALNKGALKDFTSYENLLNLFLKSYPKSNLVQEAEQLLKTFQNRKQ